MKLAFLILTIDPPSEQFIKLLNFLRSFDNSIIYIHHDFYKSDFDKEVINKYKLILPEKHYKTYWSHINNVMATWDAIKDIYQNYDFDWLITLTPTCFPIKSKEYIINHLQNSQYDAFMEHRLITKEPKWDLEKWLYRDVYHKKIHIPIINKDIFVKRNKRIIPFDDNFKIYHGSNYFQINRKTVEILLKQEDKYQQFLKYYKTFHCEQQHPCPQEIVLQSMILNHQNKIKVCDNYFRYIKWLPSHWSPEWLDERYFEEIKKSDAIFARKFKSPISNRLIEMIEKQLL